MAPSEIRGHVCQVLARTHQSPGMLAQLLRIHWLHSVTATTIA